MSFNGRGSEGTGTEFGVEDGTRSVRDEKMAAVAVAPVAAEMLAMMARVVLDITVSWVSKIVNTSRRQTSRPCED